jgi:hypothetical protein
LIGVPFGAFSYAQLMHDGGSGGARLMHCGYLDK